MLKNENNNIDIYCLVQKLSITLATYFIIWLRGL